MAERCKEASWFSSLVVASPSFGGLSQGDSCTFLCWAFCVVFAVWLFVSWFFWFLLFVWCCNLVPSSGGFVLADYIFRDSAFRIACCYAPNHNPGRDAFLHRCIDSIDLVLDRVVARRGSCPFDTSRERCQFFCVIVVWLTFDGSSTPMRRASRGPGGMVSWLLALILLDLLCFFSSHTALPLP